MRSPPKTLTMGNKAKFRPSGQVFVTLAAKEMCMKTCLVSVQLGHDRKLRCRGKSHLCYHQSPIATPTDSTAMHRVHFQITASYPTALTAIHWAHTMHLQQKRQGEQISQQILPTWSIHLFPCMQARQLQHERNTQSVRKKSIRWWTGRSSPNWYSINVFHINKFDDRKIIRELRQYKEKPERLSRLWWLRLLRIWSNLQTSQWTSNTKPT